MTAPTQIQSFRNLDTFSGDLVAPVHRANGTPINGTTGTLAGVAQPGDLLLANDGGTVALYQNTNTQASPTWSVIESLSDVNAIFASPPALGSTAPAAVHATTMAATSVVVPPESVGGATKILTSADSGKTILLDQVAGATITLPAASGSGNRYRFTSTATLTSNANKILAASSSDNLIGFVTGENSGTAKCFASAAAAANHSLQMPFAGTQPSGGFEGDWWELEDVAANTWAVKGCYQAGTTPTTPFSTATS